MNILRSAKKLLQISTIAAILIGGLAMPVQASTIYLPLVAKSEPPPMCEFVRTEDSVYMNVYVSAGEYLYIRTSATADPEEILVILPVAGEIKHVGEVVHDIDWWQAYTQRLVDGQFLVTLRCGKSFKKEVTQ